MSEPLKNLITAILIGLAIYSIWGEDLKKYFNKEEAPIQVSCADYRSNFYSTYKPDYIENILQDNSKSIAEKKVLIVTISNYVANREECFSAQFNSQLQAIKEVLLNS